MIAAALDSRHRHCQVTVEIPGYRFTGRLDSVDYIPAVGRVQMQLRLRRPGETFDGKPVGLPPQILSLDLPRLYPIDVGPAVQL